MIIKGAFSVPGTVEALYNWWSDYTGGVIDDRRFSRVTREIISREGDTVVMKDTFTRPLRFTDTTTVKLVPPDRIEFSSDSSVWKAEGVYTFSQQGERVEAALEVHFRPQGLWRILFRLPFVKGRVIREFDEDLSGHLSEFEKDMTQGRGRAAA